MADIFVRASIGQLVVTDSPAFKRIPVEVAPAAVASVSMAILTVWLPCPFFKLNPRTAEIPGLRLDSYRLAVHIHS